MVPIVSIVFMIALPAYAIHKNLKSIPVKHPYLWSCGSFMFCIWGIISEIITIKRRLFSGDIGGIEDTIGAVVLICVIMMISTLVINLILLGLSYVPDDDQSSI